MAEKIKNAFFAGTAGNDLRKIFTGEGRKEEETDNKFRGTIYQLINAVNTNNRNLFLDRITRLYTAYNLPIPTIFIKTFESDDDFKEIGYAYILGLKGGFFESKDKKENKTGE